MMRTLTLLLIAGTTLGCTKTSPSQQGLTQNAAPHEARPSPFLVSVVRVLEENHRSGSLAYGGYCTTSGGINDDFKVSPLQRDVPPIEALRQALGGDPRVSVKEDSSGAIRVVGSSVSSDLLGVMIHELSFKNENDPRDATANLLGSSELNTYMQGHRTEFVMTSGGLIPPPSGRILNATLHDVTLSQALDLIAKTFPGVWIYEECVTGQGVRRVVISFHEFSRPA